MGMFMTALLTADKNNTSEDNLSFQCIKSTAYYHPCTYHFHLIHQLDPSMQTHNEAVDFIFSFFHKFVNPCRP